MPPSLPSTLLAVGRAQGQDCLCQGVQGPCSRLLQVSHLQVMGMAGIEPVVVTPEPLDRVVLPSTLWLGS